MSKKFSILAAALVASGRSLSTTSILDHWVSANRSPRPVADDWSFCDGIDFALPTSERDPRTNAR